MYILSWPELPLSTVHYSAHALSLFDIVGSIDGCIKCRAAFVFSLITVEWNREAGAEEFHHSNRAREWDADGDHNDRGPPRRRAGLLAGAARRPVPSELCALVAGRETSRALCLIEWPSLTGHDPVPLRCLFTDAYPFPSPNAQRRSGGRVPIRPRAPGAAYLRGGRVLQGYCRA
jgi:hypothetical protein